MEFGVHKSVLDNIIPSPYPCHRLDQYVRKGPVYDNANLNSILLKPFYTNKILSIKQTKLLTQNSI